MARAALLLLLLLTAPGCSDLLGVLGGGPDLSLARSAPESPPGEALALTALVDGERFVLEGPEERTVRAPGTGELPVQVTLARGGGGALASASFTQRFRNGSDHWVHARVGTSRPLGHCIGHLRVLPLSPARPDTLFLTYGGIPQDAVC